jgi:hypothetical protein
VKRDFNLPTKSKKLVFNNHTTLPKIICKLPNSRALEFLKMILEAETSETSESKTERSFYLFIFAVDIHVAEAQHLMDVKYGEET